MKIQLLGAGLLVSLVVACAPGPAATLAPTPTLLPAPAPIATLAPAPTLMPTPVLMPSLEPTTQPTVLEQATATVQATESAIDPASNFRPGKYVDVNDELSVFVFTPEGRFTHYYDKVRGGSGTFSVKGDLYIQQTLNAPCRVPMNYKYTFDGKNLRFQLTDQSRNDDCGDRPSYYDGKTYVLSE